MKSNKANAEPKTKIELIKYLLGTLLTGIAAVAPVVGTILMIVYLFKAFLLIGEQIIVAGIFRFLNFMRGDEGVENPWEFVFPGDSFILLAFPLGLFFLIGWGVKNKFGAQILGWIDSVMLKLPMVGFVYGALKQFVDSVRDLGGPKKFKGVAYVEYPSPGCRLLGFITGNYHDAVTEKDVTTIFVPTSPNPATGFVIVVDDEKVMHSDLTLEQAGKLILSAGLVNPTDEESDDIV